MRIKSKTNENRITTKIKRSELLSKLRCSGGSSWCNEISFNVDWALECVNTAIADLLTYQSLYSFCPYSDYELNLTKRQIDLMFSFYKYINDGKLNCAYHELWDSIGKPWDTYDDDYISYDELISFYGLLFTFKQAAELSNLNVSYQQIKEKLQDDNIELDNFEYENHQRNLARIFEANSIDDEC